MTTTRTITVSSRRGDQTVETPYSDSEAVARLTVLVNDGKVCSSFARDLVAKSEKWGLSEKQTDWVHVLLVQAERGPVSRDVPRITMLGIRCLLDHAAAQGLKTPSMFLETEDGLTVKVNRSGENSKRPGMIYVSNGADWGSEDRLFYGSIDFDGAYTPTQHVTPDVSDVLDRLNADPEGQARAYGKRTGNCCFCSSKLSDPRSVAVGYGEICAGRFDLPWGDERADEQELDLATPFDDEPSHEADGDVDDYVWIPDQIS